MTDNIENKESLNPVADRVEKRTKEISIKSEKIINDSLDVLKDFMFKLLEVGHENTGRVIINHVNLVRKIEEMKNSSSPSI